MKGAYMRCDLCRRMDVLVAVAPETTDHNGDWVPTPCGELFESFDLCTDCIPKAAEHWAQLVPDAGPE